MQLYWMYFEKKNDMIIFKSSSYSNNDSATQKSDFWLTCLIFHSKCNVHLLVKQRESCLFPYCTNYASKKTVVWISKIHTLNGQSEMA